MLLIASLVLPFLGAVCLLFLPLGGTRTCPRFSLGVSGLNLILLALLTHQWRSVGTVEVAIAWIPQLGLDLSFWLDGPALFYSWLILGIGFLVLQYSAWYMKAEDSPYRFYASMLAFIGAMLGLVLSKNLILMFLFWEMTSLTSFLLIGHWFSKGTAIAGAQRALVVTGAGGLCLLVGIVVLQGVMRDFDPGAPLEWDAVWAAAPDIVAHPQSMIVLVLMLLGAFAKSAQFPFHFWLPGAMEAPTPVSALLHAATMVKAGIYLLGRLYPIFNTELAWIVLVGSVGVATMLVGGWLALFCRDLKQLLAYSTVSQLGLLTAYYGFGYQGVGGAAMLKTDLLLVASHALFKGGLFMLCGIVDHETGTRDRDRLGGLRRKMPITALLSVLACLSMAGMPFTLGFVAKKLFMEAGAKLTTPILFFEEALFILAALASAFTVCYCLQFAYSTFFGKPRDGAVQEKAHEGPPGLYMAPALLVAVCIIGGLYVPVVSDPLSQLVRSEFYSTKTPYTTAIFDKVDFLFWVSMGLFVVGGPAIFLLAGRLEVLHSRVWRIPPAHWISDRFFLEWVPKFAARLTSLIQSPSREINVALTLGVLVLLAGSAWLRGEGSPSPSLPWGAFEAIGMVMLLLVAILSGVVILHQNSLIRVMALGFIGLLVAFYFVLYMAPDLAITQILVELALLLMFLNLLPHFPNEGKVRRPTPVPVWLAAPIAVAMGLLMGGLTYTSATSPHRSVPILADRPTPAEYYLANSKYPQDPGGHSGGGYNVVNVILVDFRAMDTLGEIAVLAAAALGAAVLGRRTSRRRAIQVAGKPLEVSRRGREPTFPLRRNESMVLSGTAPIVSILTLSFAAVLFFAGHNQPGGGFIAGLAGCVAAIPFALRPGGALAGYSLSPRSTIPIAGGLLVAALTGAAAMVLGYPFLRSAHREIHLPLFGEMELASAIAFDLGVFLTVFGVVNSILRTLVKS